MEKTAGNCLLLCVLHKLGKNYLEIGTTFTGFLSWFCAKVLKGRKHNTDLPMTECKKGAQINFLASLVSVGRKIKLKWDVGKLRVHSCFCGISLRGNAKIMIVFACFK